MSTLLYSLCFFNFFLFFLVTLSHVVIHSILGLMCIIFGFAIILFSIQFEFLAFVLLMVYVGAVVVLFIFVSMMLDTSSLYVKNSLKFESFLFLFILAKVVPQLLILFSTCNFSAPSHLTNIWLSNYVCFSQSDVVILSVSLFSYLPAHTALISLILFIGMIGSVSICMSDKNV